MGKKSAKRVSNFLSTSAMTRPLFALGAASVLFGSGSAYAIDANTLPQNPNVVGGKDSFSQSGNTLNVNQSTNRTVIDWRSFDIGSKAQVNFNQPGTSSIAVNRVNGSTNPTDIEGGLHANGQVWILNPNGVFFGKSARVDAAGIVATTANINDKAFMAGSNRLQFTGADHGAVSNAGNITVGANGLAAFVAPSVRNSGTINATVGRVALAAGTTYTLDLAGDHLVELGLGSVKAVVDNSGRIVNPGGTIALTAKAAGQVVNSVVNVSGVVSASSATKSGGTIILGADTINTTKTASITADAGTNGTGGTITSVAAVQGNYAGTFSAKGGSKSGDGGKIETSGHSVHVDGGTRVNTLAAHGKTGNWTIDPDNLTVVAGSGSTSTTIGADTIELNMNTTGETLTANVSISVNAAIDTSGQSNSNTLYFQDGDSNGHLTVNLNAPITLGVNQHLIGDADIVNLVAGSLVQNGIDVASTSGATVNVGAGTYSAGSGIVINKSNIKLLGASGAEIDVNPGSSGQVNAITIGGATNNVTVSGLDIRGEVTGSYLTYAWGSAVSRGIAVLNGATNVTITNNDIRNVRNGILIDGRNTGNVSNNIIDNTKSAISVQYTDAGLGNTEGYAMTMTGNNDATYGNEWGVNFHLNGHYVGATYYSNSQKIATNATIAVQQALLAFSAANNGMTAQDQGYSYSNRTAVTVSTTGSDSNQGSPLNNLATIQAGINAVVSGGTVNVLNGTYVVSSGYINVNKSLDLIGQSESGVIIDARNASTYGLRVTATDGPVDLENFTLYGVTASGGYGLKAEATDGLTLSHITSEGAYKSEFDLNGVLNGSLSYLDANGYSVGTTTSTGGNGISFTNSQNITLTHSTTEHNAWGGLALYQGTTYGNLQLTGITVNGTNTFNEANGIYAQDQSSVTDIGTINLSGQGIQYIAQDITGNSDGTYTWFQTTLSGAKAIAEGSETLSGATVQGYAGTNLNGNNIFYVGTDGTHTMSIQAAINVAVANATINVDAGTYTDALNISKNVDIEGAGEGLTIIQPTSLLSTGVNHKYDTNVKTAIYVHDASNVTINGVTIDANNTNANAVVFWNNASGSITNSLIENTVALTGAQTGQGIAVDATSGQTSNLTISGVTFQYWNKNAIDAVTGDGGGAGTGGNIILNVSDSTFTGRGPTGAQAQNGIVLWERGGGSVSATLDGDTFSNIDYTGNDATASGVLMYGSPNGTLTVENSTFDSSVEEYIALDGGSTNEVDATLNNTFGGVTVSGATSLNNLYSIENKLVDSQDDSSNGMIRLVDGQVYVTAAKDNIQGGIDGASSGDTVHIQAGTYTGTMDITKNLDIVGAGEGQTIIQATSLLDTGVGHKYDADVKTVVFVNGASDVNISGMTIDANNLGANAVVFWNNSSGSINNVLIENWTTPSGLSGAQTGQGLAVDATSGHTSNLTVANVTFQNWNKNAIDAVTGDGATTGGGNITLNVTNSTFTGAGATGTIAQNGIVLWERAGGTVNATINNDDFSDIAYTGNDANAAGILMYGSPNGTLTVSNSTFDSSVQYYIALDGGSAHEVNATNHNTFGGVTVSSTTALDDIFAIENKLIDAIDDTTNGLVRLAAGKVFVTADKGDIQAGVTHASAGDSVYLQDGDYTLTGELDITKSLSLIGESAATNITSLSTGYGINVTADNVSLKDFTFHGPTTAGSSTYGIKVTPDTGAASDRLLNFDIEDVTIDGGYRTGLDLNGVNGATIKNVSVSNIVHGNGIALTDSANVTITGSSTSNNAWGGLALYQTNAYYNQQLNNIVVDGTNSFHETNGVYEEDQSASLDMGSNVTIAGYSYADIDNSVSTDKYMFFQKTQQGAVNFATDSSLNGGHLSLANVFIEGWTGSALNNIFTVGTGANSVAMSIAAANNAASNGATINVLAGNYTLANQLDITKSITLNGAGVGTTNITSNSTGYGINVTADNVSLTNFTFNAPTTHNGVTYGIKVTPDTNVASDRLLNFDIENVTINGGWRTGLDLNGVLGATINNVSVSNVQNGNGIALTDSANVTLTNVTTTNNAWGGLALYQTNTYYNQQLNNIVVDATNTFNEANGVYEEDQSASLDMGSLTLANYNFADIDKSVANDQYTFFQKTQQGAIDFALNATANSGHLSVANTYVEGWSGTALNNIFYVGYNTGNTAHLNINTAVGAATANGTINVGSGIYGEDVAPGTQLTFNFGNVTVNSLTLGSAAAGSTLTGHLTSNTTITSAGAVNLSGNFTAAGIALNGTVSLAGNTVLDTRAAGGNITVASVTGNSKNLTLDAGGHSISLGNVADAGTLRVNGASTLTGTSYDGDQLNFQGNVTLTHGTAFTSSNGTIDLVAVIGGGNNVSIDAGSGNISLGNVANAGALTVASAVTLTGGTYVAKSEAFNGAVTLTTGTTLNTSANNGNITVASVVGGSNNLEINAGTGNTALGNVAGIGALQVDGKSTLTGTSYAATTESFGGAVTLANDTTLTANNVTVASVIGGGNDLAITGAASLGNVAGAGALSVSGAATLTGTSYVAASESFGAVTLTGDTTLDTSAAGGNITVASVTGAGNDLTIDAGTGNTALGNVAGAGALTVDGAATLTGTSYAATSESFGGAVTLTGDTTLDASGAVSVASVTGGGNDLTIDGSAISLGNVAGVGALAVSGPATLTGTTYAAASEAFDAVTLTGDTTLDASGAVSVASVTGGSNDLTIDGASASLGNVSGVGALAVSAPATLTGTTYAAASETFGAVTLTGDTTLTANNVTLASVTGAGNDLAISGAASLGNVSGAGALSVSGPATLTGTSYVAASEAFGAVTLTGDTKLDTSAANGAITVASVTGGGNDLTIDSGTGLTTLGNVAGAGALAVDGAAKLTGSTYNANSILFGGDVTLTASTTTLNTSAAAGNITVEGDIFGTTDGGQSLVLNAGPGTGSASSNGDITLQNAGTSTVNLNNLTVTGNNFTALTVDLAGNYNATLTGNQVFAADTLNVKGNATSTVGGNASGHVVAGGDVNFTAQGDVSGTISGTNVSLTGDDVNATVTASDTANVKGNTVEGSYTADTLILTASNNVDAAVSATDFTLAAANGSVSGTWTSIDTSGSGVVDVNGQPTVGQGNVNPNQLVVEGFVLPAGTTIGANGQLILPQGVLLGLLSPGGGKPKMILVHSVQQLGELLASGYSVIVIDLSNKDSGKPIQLASN